MALVENDPSARVQFRRLGELRSPASCYVCGSGTREEGYLDFDTFIDYHGNFYLCVECAKQCANVMGWISPEEAATQIDLAESLLTKNAELEETNERLNLELAVFNDALANINLARAGSVSGDSNEQGDPDPASVTEGSKDRKPELKKSVKSTGRTDSSGSVKRHFTSTSD